MRTELLQRELKHLKAPAVAGAGDLQQDSVVESSALTRQSTPEAAPGGSTAGDAVEDAQPVVNCTAHPMFCSPKVNCSTDPITAEDKADWDKRLATADGHANLRTWCLAYPAYATSLQMCVVANDMVGYADATYKAQQEAQLDSADAVYCYVAGHCNNTEVSLNTTLEQAEHLCDAHYGHKRWTGVGWKDFEGVLARAQDMVVEGAQNLTEGKTTWADLMKLARRESDISAMTACAMGNYHCDVFYCKQHYCNNPMYDRFKNMSWAY